MIVAGYSFDPDAYTGHEEHDLANPLPPGFGFSLHQAGVTLFNFHPLAVLDAEHRVLLDLASAAGGGGFGGGNLPEAGGVLDQSVATMESVAIIRRTWQALRSKGGKNG